MKGTIAKCIEELVTAKFGAPKWKEVLKKAGLSEFKLYSTMEDVEDKEVMGLIQAASSVSGLPMAAVLEAFGEYWSNTYAPKVYGVYFTKAHSTREFLANLDDIHVTMTRTIKNAHPPRFTYEWKGDKDLVMHYESSRGLVALMPGLIAGLGKHFKDSPKVRTQGNDIHVHFS